MEARYRGRTRTAVRVVSVLLITAMIGIDGFFVAPQASAHNADITHVAITTPAQTVQANVAANIHAQTQDSANAPHKVGSASVDLLLTSTSVTGRFHEGNLSGGCTTSADVTFV